MPALGFSLCLFLLRCHGRGAHFDKDSHQRYTGGSCLCCFPCRMHIAFPPSLLSSVLQCSVSVGGKPKHRVWLCHSLLALGRRMKALGPSLVAAAVCLHAPGEKAELELQGRLRALLLHVSIVVLLGKVRRSKSQSTEARLRVRVSYRVCWQNNPHETKPLQFFSWTYSLKLRWALFSWRIWVNVMPGGVHPHHLELFL